MRLYAPLGTLGKRLVLDLRVIFRFGAGGQFFNGRSKHDKNVCKEQDHSSRLRHHTLQTQALVLQLRVKPAS